MKKKYLFCLALVFSFVVALPLSAKADGMVISRPEDRENDYSVERNQNAYINYQDGTQKMILTIGLDNKDKDALWLFPVPANPEKVTIDILKSTPSFNGSDVPSMARNTIVDAAYTGGVSQLYAPFLFSLGQDGYVSSGYKGGMMLDVASSSDANTTSSDVTIYETLNKEGITTQIISAKNADALYDYFTTKKLNVERGQIPVLDKYIGKNYSFIASWVNKNSKTDQEIVWGALEKYFLDLNSGFNIGMKKFSFIITDTLNDYPDYLQLLPKGNGVSYRSEPYELGYMQNHAEVKQIILDKIVNNAVALKEIKDYLSVYEPSSVNGNQQRGVYVAFPTNKIFFPLMPTSVYGSTEVPATIRIIGYHTPEIFTDIKPYTNTEYFYSPSGDFHQSDLDTFFGKTSVDHALKYTKIEIKAPSNTFTDDLWVNQKTPARIEFLSNVSAHPWVVGIIMFIIISFVSGMLIGGLIFKCHLSKAYIFGLLGLFNFLSVIGFAIATFMWPTREVKDPEVLQFMKSRGMSTFGLRIFDVRKFVFVPVVSLTITILLWAVIILANKYMGVGTHLPFSGGIF